MNFRHTVYKILLLIVTFGALNLLDEMEMYARR